MADDFSFTVTDIKTRKRKPHADSAEGADEEEDVVVPVKRRVPIESSALVLHPLQSSTSSSSSSSSSSLSSSSSSSSSSSAMSLSNQLFAHPTPLKELTSLTDLEKCSTPPIIDPTPPIVQESPALLPLSGIRASHHQPPMSGPPAIPPASRDEKSEFDESIQSDDEKEDEKEEETPDGEIQINIPKMPFADKVKLIMSPLPPDAVLESYLDVWYNVWCEFPAGKSQDAFSRICELYEMTPGANMDTAAIEKRYREFALTFRDLTTLLLDASLLGLADDEARARTEKVAHIHKNILKCYVQVMQMMEIQNPLGPSPTTALPDLCRLLDYESIDLSSGANEHHHLIQDLMERANLHGYGKIGGDIYRPIRTDDGHNTHAWEYVSSISDFIHESAYPFFHNWKYWKMLYSRGGVASSMEQHLTVMKDDRLPNLKRDRYTFSFSNGVYRADKDEFYPYKSKHFQSLGRNVVSAKFFNMPFENRKWNRLCAQHIGGWQQIPTPAVESICEKQEWEPEVRKWLYIMIGRMMYELRVFDNWQVMPVFYGKGGTGKSTILEIMSMLYEPSDVAVLNNSMERTFQLESIVEKYIYLAMDVKEDFNLQQATWNSMVTGEKVAVMRKYKVAISQWFRIPGAMACNTLPEYNDAGKNFTRRLLLFLFNNAVTKGNPKLLDEAEEQMPALIKKANIAYQEAVGLFGHKTLEEGVVPKYFLDARRTAQMESNPVIRCLEDKGFLSKHPNYYMDMHTFIDELKQYCKLRSMKMVGGFKENVYADVLASYNLTVHHNMTFRDASNPSDPEARRHGTIIRGICPQDWVQNFKAEPDLISAAENDKGEKLKMVEAAEDATRKRKLVSSSSDNSVKRRNNNPPTGQDNPQHPVQPVQPLPPVSIAIAK